MGMYDELRAINITHENFDSNHKDLKFQTKDLECELSEYCVFNSQLYLEGEHDSDGYVRHAEAIKSDHSGEVRIYTEVTRSKVVYWVEYDLIFVDGMLVDVVSRGEHISRDNRDMEAHRPSLPRNRVSIKISIGNCDEDKRQAVMARLTDEKIEAIRELLEEPLATVSYPVKRTNTSSYTLGFSADYGNILSVVQTMDDIEVGKNNKRPVIVAPSGDRIMLDEFSGHSNQEAGDKAATDSEKPAFRMILDELSWHPNQEAVDETATDSGKPRVLAIDEMHNFSKKHDSEKDND